MIWIFIAVIYIGYFAWIEKWSSFVVKIRNSSFVSYAFNYKLGFKFEVIWDYHGISSSLF